MQAQGPLAHWSTPAGPWTEPDLHLFPQDGHRYEIIDGGLHVTPPADESHESVACGLVTALRAAAPSGWWACSRVGIGIGTSNLVPDVTVLRPHASGAIWTDPADVALVVEVETAATRRLDRLLKPAVYAEAGIAAYWRVERGDPHGPVLLRYDLADGEYTLRDRTQGRQLVTVDSPFPLRTSPSSWV